MVYDTETNEDGRTIKIEFDLHPFSREHHQEGSVRWDEVQKCWLLGNDENIEVEVNVVDCSCKTLEESAREFPEL
jgi:hypothetical protein